MPTNNTHSDYREAAIGGGVTGISWTVRFLGGTVPELAARRDDAQIKLMQALDETPVIA